MNESTKKVIKSMKSKILLIAFLFTLNGAFSQENQIPVRNDQTIKPVMEEKHEMDLGFGIGIDYGGFIGIQAGYIPIEYLTVFGAAGYYLVGFGWQVGVKGLFIPKTTRHTVRPFLKGEYGTNSAIVVSGTGLYDKVYTGFTIGAGSEFRFGKKKRNGFDVVLDIPIRTTDFWDDWNNIKSNPSLEVTSDPLPVAISIGYHHEF